jgi:MoxR-like ATPase
MWDRSTSGIVSHCETRQPARRAPRLATREGRQALIRATRGRPTLLCGASPRAANMLAVASRALAVLRGRDFVIPDDVKALAVPALRHRVVLAPGAEIEGLTAEAVVAQVIEQVPAPR